MNISVIICPTVKRALFEWRVYCNHNQEIIEKAKLSDLSVKLMDGRIIRFIGETEAQRVLLGLHADMSSIDEFIISCDQDKE